LREIELFRGSTELHLWLAFKQGLSKKNMLGLTPKLRSEFAAFNTLTVSDAKFSEMPCDEISH
jgi:hypothetical protein